LQTPDVSTSFATYSRNANEISTYDVAKTAFRLRRIPRSVNLILR